MFAKIILLYYTVIKALITEGGNRMLKQKRKRRSNKIFIFVLIVVAVICGGIIYDQEKEIYRVKQEKEATLKRIEALQNDRQNLTEERKQLDNPKYLERIAREEYNMVGKNEVPLFIVEEGKEQPQK